MLNERTIRAHRKDIIGQIAAKKKANPVDKNSLFPELSCTSIMLLEKEIEVLDLILEDEEDLVEAEWDWRYSLCPIIRT